MRVLGIDPGTAITGYGVVESDGSGLALVSYGAITTPAGMALPARLEILHRDLSKLIEQHRPDALAVEEVFFSRNVRTALAVGHARGVALLAAAIHQLPVHEYTPLQVKDAVVGYGKATKDQVQQMVRVILALDFIPQPDDAADAIAIAICDANSARLNELLASADG